MSFPPGQIVRLAQDQRRLYAEVIDYISDRDMLWARPLLLVQSGPAQWSGAIAPDQIQDLREEAHLLWPTPLFAAAIDVEMLPLLPYLTNAEKPAPPKNTSAALAMRQFMDAVWAQQWEQH